MRTRTVHPADMVAHLWAHKSQDFARNPGHNFYFHGDTIYSYGSHFPVAHHVENKRGQAVLFTTHSYSATTAGHKCMVEGACRHLTVFHVADVHNSDCRKQFADYRARFTGLVGKYAKSRQRKPDILAELRGLVEEANQLRRILRLAGALDPARRFDGHDCRMSSNRQTRKGASNGKRQSKRGKRWSACKSGLTGNRITARPTALSGCGSRATNCKPRSARGFPLHMPSRLSGFSSACTIRGKPISATGILSTSDNSPLIPLTLRGT